jgi:hypothetical protein
LKFDLAKSLILAIPKKKKKAADGASVYEHNLGPNITYIAVTMFQGLKFFKIDDVAIINWL